MGSIGVRIGFDLALNGFDLGSFCVKKIDTFAVGGGVDCLYTMTSG